MLLLLLAQAAPSWDWEAWSGERQRTTYEVALAPSWYRPIGSPDPRWQSGSELAVGTRSVTYVAPFILSLSARPVLRVFDSRAYALSLLDTVSVTVRVGPLEPDVGGGLSTVTLDAIHGAWSAELFSPRAVAGAWFHFGRLRVGAHVFGEYLWRWFGNDSYLLRGVDIELGLEAPPLSRSRD